MKRSWSAVAGVLVLALFWSGASPAQEASGKKNVEITVCNSNLSLIRELRQMTLAGGVGRLTVPDIPGTIDGTSLHVRSTTDPSSVSILEQNFQYDLVHQAKILEKYLGRQVDFVRLDPATNREFTVTGTLLATGYIPQPVYGSFAMTYSGGYGMVAEIDGKIEINPAGGIVLPALPEGLIIRPQLEWLVSNKRPGDHTIELTYLAGQLNWSSDYVAVLGKDDDVIDLTGWVTLTNNSGTSFMDAGLKLVAGDVNIVRNRMEKSARFAADGITASESAPQFAQSELFEYKLYTLQRRTDIRNNETKQVELVAGENVPARKVFIYDGLADQWRSWYRNASYRSHSGFGQESNRKVGTFVTFRNESSAGLGIPLPGGKIRVYKKDAEGKEQFIGEDMIDHTPKDEELRLYLGNAFDIVGERVQKDFKSYASGTVLEETIEITLRNHKEEPVEVMAYEHPWRWSEWGILRSSGNWEKVDQTTIRFPVRLEKNQEKKVTYTIRYSW
jgi:hypothetical protein